MSKIRDIWPEILDHGSDIKLFLTLDAYLPAVFWLLFNLYQISFVGSQDA